MKTFLIKLLNVVLIAGILACYQGYAMKRQKKVDAYNEKVAEYKRAESASKNQYADGVFEGSGDGYGGRIKVRVTVKDHMIQKAEILSADKETPEYLESAKRILEDVAAVQSADVDIVTGATLSSAGIIFGVNEALEKSNTAGAE